MVRSIIKAEKHATQSVETNRSKTLTEYMVDIFKIKKTIVP